MTYDPNDIALKIVNYQEQIEHLKRQVANLEQLVAELMCLDICDFEGNMTFYADWK